MSSSFNSILQGHTVFHSHSKGDYIHSNGSGNSKMKADLCHPKRYSQFTKTKVTQDLHPVSRKYLDVISTNLTFSNDVIEDRCLHMMPYNVKYFAGIFEPDKLKSTPKKANRFHGLINKGADSHKTSHHLKSISKPNRLVSLELANKKKAFQLHKKAILASQDRKRSKSAGDSTPSDSSRVFMTEIDSGDKSIKKIRPFHKTKHEVQQSSAKNIIKTNPLNSEMTSHGAQNKTIKIVDIKNESASTHRNVSDDNKEEQSDENIKSDWDDYLLSKMSQMTANWIVHECTEDVKQKEKLSKVFESWHGHPVHTNLVNEETSDEDDASKKEQKPKRKWKKAEAVLLERVYNMTPPPVNAVDPYSDDNNAPFYRQPAGIRKQKKINNKELAGAVNTTALNITIPEHVEIPHPKLKDLLNPHVGDKIYETDNLYQQEWLTGKSHVFNIDDDPSEILMETSNKYKKQLQQEMPLKYNMWYTNEFGKTTEMLPSRKVAFPKPERGLKRWIALPLPVNEAEKLMTVAPTDSESKIQKSADSQYLQTIKQNHTLLSIVHEWRSKWFICGQFEDSTTDDLIRDMADIQSHVRLKAIGTIAKAAEYKPALTKSAVDSSDCKNVHGLPEKICIALECLLDDSHDQVRKAAAVTLFTLERPNDKAKLILREMLMSESELVRWTGAHCLSQYGECDSDVVAEVIKQILSTESAIKYQQGIYLLAKISTNSNIVHCMVAEQLNSNIWRHRVIACKILPTLFGPINRDVTQKLSNMMWNDWHVEVRNAAAQCLGKTSHGRDVHDGIKEKLINGTEKTKLEAVSKLGQLGIMTAKLLPAFLQCFDSPYVSIRCEVCIACGNLKIRESQVINQLVQLAMLDQSWKVKALAIQALGKIGEASGEIKECLLWAVRYEKQPGVRAEACHSLMALNIQGDDVIDTLQEHLLVESNQIVRDEVTNALSMLGFSTTEDSEMVAQVKSVIHKLSNPDIISSQIIVNEMDDNKRAQLIKMVNLTEEDVEALNKKKAVMLKNIRSQVKSLDSHPSIDKPIISGPSPKGKLISTSLTPEPLSREGTDFTLVADKELEALLSHDKSETWSASSKSLPPTRESLYSLEGKDVSGKMQEEINKHSIIIHAAVDEQRESQSNFTSREVTYIESEEEKGKKSAGLSNYLSLPHSQPPVSSKNGSLSPSSSVADPKSSRLPLEQFYSHKSKVNKDVMKEKEKFNQDVSTIYQKLDARYIDLSSDLMKIDKGYNISEFSAHSGINDSCIVMSVDGTLSVSLGMEDNLLENDATGAVNAGTTGPDIEMQDTLQNKNNTLKDFTVDLNQEDQEFLQSNGEICTVKNYTVNLHTEKLECMQNNEEANTIAYSGVDLNTEVQESLQKYLKINTIKDLNVDLNMEVKENLQENAEISTIQDSTVDLNAKVQESFQVNYETDNSELYKEFVSTSIVETQNVLGTEVQQTAPRNSETRITNASSIESDTKIQEKLQASSIAVSDT